MPDGVPCSTEGDGREACIHEDVAGRRLRVSAGSFFQSGPVAAAALAPPCGPRSVTPSNGGAVVVDLYAGVGMLGGEHRSPARVVRVVAVESDPMAVADARANLGDLDARVVASEVARWRPTGPTARPRPRRRRPVPAGLGRPGAGAVALPGAPARAGQLRPGFPGSRPVLLAAPGYRLVSVAVVDPFPHTFHVETVSRFDR